MNIENWRQVARFNKAMVTVGCLAYDFNNDLASNIELVEPTEVIELFPDLSSTVEEYRQICSEAKESINNTLESEYAEIEKERNSRRGR